jgi:hypothetical protein
MSSDSILDLDALTGNAGQVRYQGKVHDIHPLDAAGYKQLQRMRAGGPDAPDSFDTMTTLAKRVCPTLASKIDEMNLTQIMGIVTKAGSHIAGVENHPKSKRRPSGVVPPRRRG